MSLPSNHQFQRMQYLRPIAEQRHEKIAAFDVFLAQCLPGPACERMVSLSSLQGQTIEERISMKSEEEFIVNDLPSGMYVVRIEAPEGSRWIRVVKK